MAQNNNNLLPSYLINGADTLKRDTALVRLRKRVESMGDLSLNYDVFKGDSASGADIVDACNTLPFASPVRLVQVDDADKLPKAESEQLVEYLGSPNETTVLALSATGLRKTSRLYKAVDAIGKTSIIDCTPMKRKDLPAAVRSMAVTHGVAITPGAANTLIDLVGEDTVALDAQIQKLVLAHRGSDPINESEVTSLVSRTSEVKPWEFVDAFSARNASRCVMLLGRMESMSPYALLTMCVTRLRELVMAKSLVDRGQGGSLAKMLGMPDWRVKNHASWTRAFSSEQLHRALVDAVETERRMKSGSDPNDEFLLWVLSVVKR